MSQLSAESFARRTAHLSMCRDKANKIKSVYAKERTAEREKNLIAKEAEGRTKEQEELHEIFMQYRDCDLRKQWNEVLTEKGLNSQEVKALVEGDRVMLRNFLAFEAFLLGAGNE